MPVPHPVLVIWVGAGLLVLAVMFRLGLPPRVRGWVGEETLHTVHLLVPGMGLLLVFLGCWPWVDESPRVRAVAMVTGPLGWLAMLGYLAPWRIPLWLLPRWCHDAVRARRAAPESPRSRKAR